MAALPEPTADEAERRVAPRARTLKSAKILFNNRYSTFDCIVRNISATGALLTIDPAVPLPKSFEIRIDEDLRLAKLVYRRESFAGIHFLNGAEDGEGDVRIAPEAEAMPQEFMESLRIHPRPLPFALASRLPWLRD